MKRNQKVEVGGKKLTLSLSFGTSLKILDEVASPSYIVESVLRGYFAEKAGESYEAEFVFNERNSTQIIHIANEDHEGLSFDEIGELASEETFIKFYGIVIGYLNELVMGRSKEAGEPQEPKDDSAEK